MGSQVADIGVIGLGTMGAMLSLNFAEKGSDVAVFNRTVAKADKLREDNPELAPRLHPRHSLEDFVAALRTPRVIVLMVNTSGGPSWMKSEAVLHRLKRLARTKDSK